jgi:hypothetical protein
LGVVVEEIRLIAPAAALGRWASNTYLRRRPGLPAQVGRLRASEKLYNFQPKQRPAEGGLGARDVDPFLPVGQPLFGPLPGRLSPLLVEVLGALADGREHLDLVSVHGSDSAENAQVLFLVACVEGRDPVAELGHGVVVVGEHGEVAFDPREHDGAHLGLDCAAERRAHVELERAGCLGFLSHQTFAPSCFACSTASSIGPTM